ncbi:MAG: ATP-dependent metallopeptidase FtsH/Yme1/Tma family protein, partial [Firmicutes bacterium]|nr:ATP-dependent metallopeptidase FtsH/Yme1/Tma family protein [Bacillota bacterium]
MKIWRDLLFYLLLAVVLLWVVLKVQTPVPNQVARLSYLEFKQQVASGVIKTAVIDNNSGQIWGKYKERGGLGLGPNGATEYRTAGPLRTDLLEPLLDRYQVEYE